MVSSCAPSAHLERLVKASRAYLVRLYSYKLAATRQKVSLHNVHRMCSVHMLAMANCKHVQSALYTQGVYVFVLVVMNE